jgi:hypothetical protein
MNEEQLGSLIGFTINAGTSPADKRKFFRALYGWRDKSQFGKYEYMRDGLLTNIPYVHLTRGVFIVARENRLKVKRFLKGKARIIERQVVLTQKDKKVLFAE